MNRRIIKSRTDEELKNDIFLNNRRLTDIIYDRERVFLWADDMFAWLFAIKPQLKKHSAFLEEQQKLNNDLCSIIRGIPNMANNSQIITDNFLNALPEIHKSLTSNLESFFTSDPAAKSVSEILLTYPGFYAVVIHRLAHQLLKLNVPLIPRLLSEYAHSKTGIDINPGASIGSGFVIDHGTGVVIGETCIIGDNVKIYQGVTLGALSVNRRDASVKRHPTIGNNVVIYANATILGGNTCIGDNSVIGGNVWLTHSVPKNSMVFHKSEIIIKNSNSFPSAISYVI